MAITVALARVKERCAIADTTYDTVIQNLIDDWVPALTYSLDPAVTADADVNLQTLLNLAALEIVSGEFLAQQYREPGYADAISLGGLTITPPKVADWLDPSGLKAQGIARMAPFVRPGYSPALARGVRAGRIEACS